MKEKINKAKACPYCFCEPKYVDSSVIYGTSYGYIYLCKPCDAYVGVHRGTSKALGRLANRQLRELKKEAHFYFDKLWNRKMEKGFRKKVARGLAYKWLSTKLEIPFEDTHIGMFDEELCQKTVEICRPYALRL